jgi:hypothetical protein
MILVDLEETRSRTCQIVWRGKILVTHSTVIRYGISKRRFRRFEISVDLLDHYTFTFALFLLSMGVDLVIAATVITHSSALLL